MNTFHNKQQPLNQKLDNNKSSFVPYQEKDFRKRKPLSLTLHNNDDNDDSDECGEQQKHSYWNTSNNNNNNNNNNNGMNNTSSNNTTYRADGISIGSNYLRLDSKTISRGVVSSTNVNILEIIGKGAFSTVYRGTWRNTTGSHHNQRHHDDNNNENHIQQCNNRNNTKNTTEDISTTTNSSTNAQIVDVAIKQFAITESDSVQIKMLHREVRMLVTIQSQSLVQLYGSYHSNDVITFVLEYMNGGSLICLFEYYNNKHIIKQQQKCESVASSTCTSNRNTTSSLYLSESMIATIFYQILCGLEYLHSAERRIIHRDVKPANVLFDYTTGYIKLCDFGISSLLNDNSFNTTIIGTKHYMSPERLRGKSYTRSSDIWSLGLIIVQCITGTIPYTNSIYSIFDLVISIEETTNPIHLIPNSIQINNSLREMIIGCLQLDPNKRIPASCLLHSPLFETENNISSINDATLIMKQELESIDFHPNDPKLL